MLWIKAFHIIFMVAWFAALFYLPRLFVYHAQCTDSAGNERFKIMERKLYRGIMWPGAILTTFFGIWLLSDNFSFFMHAPWMQIKLALVFVLWIYHLYCGKILKLFAQDKNTRSHVFYRWFNELPTLILIAVIILAVVGI